MNPRSLVAAAAGASVLLTGCGFVDGPTESSPTTTATVATPPGTPGSPAAFDPSDRNVTPSGSTLKVGKTATVNYETKPLSQESTKLAVTVASVEKGTIADLEDFDLDAQTRVGVPFYVTVQFHNVGSKTMKPSGILGLVAAHNATGEAFTRLHLIGGHDQCDGAEPEKLAVGASYTECAVYIAPAGQSVSEVVFAFYLGDDRTEIRWTST